MYVVDGGIGEYVQMRKKRRNVLSAVGQMADSVLMGVSRWKLPAHSSAAPTS